MAVECFLGCLGLVGALPVVKAMRAWESVAGQMKGEYTLRDMIGSGAYGMVYSGSDKAGKHVAVKVISRSRTALEDVQKEAAMMERLSHSNLVGFRQLFVGPRHVCLVMDHYGGGDLVEALQRRMRKDRTPPASDALAHIAAQLASAVHYMHRRCIVHRDIKGDNVMLDRPDHLDAQCHVAIGDFGTARSLQSEEDRLHSPAGTKLYWAPEFFDMNYGMKVDVWAVGIVVYSLVAHRFPFRDEVEARQRAAHIPAGFSPECRDFLKSALSKTEARRPTASQLAVHAWIQGLVPAFGSESTDGDADGEEESDDESPGAMKCCPAMSDASTCAADDRVEEPYSTRTSYAATTRQSTSEGSVAEAQRPVRRRGHSRSTSAASSASSSAATAAL